MSKDSKTYKILRETMEVSQEVKDNLKSFNKIKRKILKAIKDNPLSVPELSKVIEMSTSDTLYYLMTLAKYDLVVTDSVDDMDEYFYYKSKK